MSLRQQITADLTAAMKSRDAARTSTLRMVKAALQNREIVSSSTALPRRDRTGGCRGDI